MGRYSMLFQLHEVDMHVLPLLTLEDLRDIPIKEVGTRRLFLRHLSQWNRDVAPSGDGASLQMRQEPLGTTNGVPSMNEWLRCHRLSRYGSVFEVHAVTPFVLPYLTLEDLEDMLPEKARSDAECILHCIQETGRPARSAQTDIAAFKKLG